MKVAMPIDAFSDAGPVRSSNEDRFGSDAELELWTVADGMGGHAAGEVAAQLVVEVLPLLLREQVGARPEAAPGSLLGEALVATSQRVAQAAQNSDFAGMGATVVALWLHRDSAFVGHLGDSRAYLWRAGHLELLTRDHSLVELLLESGDLSPAEAAAHPARHQVTRYCGMSGQPLPEVRQAEVQAGDRLLLCTDGVSNEIPHNELARLCGEGREAARQVVEAAFAAGGSDNATAVVVTLLPAAETERTATVRIGSQPGDRVKAGQDDRTAY